MDENQQDFVRRVLKERRVPLTVVAKDTGVPVTWLEKFARGRWKDSGYNRVRMLSTYLKSKLAEQPDQSTPTNTEATA